MDMLNNFDDDNLARFILNKRDYLKNEPSRCYAGETISCEHGHMAPNLLKYSSNDIKLVAKEYECIECIRLTEEYNKKIRN